MISWKNNPDLDRILKGLIAQNFGWTEISKRMTSIFKQDFTPESIRNRIRYLKRAKSYYEDNDPLPVDVNLLVDPNLKLTPDEIETDKLIELLQERGYAVEELGLSNDVRYKVSSDRFDGDIYKFISMSDTHLCSKYQQLSYTHAIYDYAVEHGIKDVYHSGDMTEGNGHMYPGQRYEIFIHGADAQKEYAVDKYPYRKGVKTKVIGGSHDASWWKSDGYDILKNIAKEREDIKYLGYAGAYLDIMPDKKGNSISVYLCHPSGGIPYAISYRAQKVSENFAPENKPDIMLMGHLHVSNFMPMYRNIATFNVPCLQSQTPYLKGKGHYPHLGFWIVELTINKVDRNKPGIAGIKIEYKPFYVPKERDY